MKKKFLSGLVCLVCFIMAGAFLFAGCDAGTITAQDWLAKAAVAERNWTLVGEAEDTVEARTIVYSRTDREYDFEDEFWNESKETTTVIRSGYKADRKYYVKTVTTNIDVDSTETTTKERYLGKVADNSWMLYEYEYNNNVKPLSPTYMIQVATTASDYLSELNNSGINTVTYKLFNSSSYGLEKYINKNIAQVESFASFEMSLYENIFGIEYTQNGEEYKMTYSMDNIYGCNYVSDHELVIKDGKYSSIKMSESNQEEQLDETGDIKVVEKIEQTRQAIITYTGTVTIPVVYA